MRIAIIDDRKEDREHLSEMINNYLGEYNHSAVYIATFESGEQFLQDFKKGKYDLIFLQHPIICTSHFAGRT